MLIVYRKRDRLLTEAIKKALFKYYEIRDEGDIEYFLRVRVLRNREKRTINLV